jgi:hypothetical protein
VTEWRHKGELVNLKSNACWLKQGGCKLQHIDLETRHQQQSVDSNKKLSTWYRYTHTGSYPYPHGCGCGCRYDFCNLREILTLVSRSGFLRVRVTVRVCRKHTHYKPLPIPTGRGFGGYGYGYSQKYPWVTRAHHYWKVPSLKRGVDTTAVDQMWQNSLIWCKKLCWLQENFIDQGLRSEKS